MITNEDILNMNFYKKEKFTGSYLGMRYLIQKAVEEVPATVSSEASAETSAEASDGDAPVEKIDIFRVCIWPGPYNFATTPDEQKTYHSFPFTPEGKQQTVDWLNEQWTARETEWPVR